MFGLSVFVCIYTLQSKLLMIIVDFIQFALILSVFE